MLIRILRQTSIAGRPARVGDVVELPRLEATYFVAIGKGEVVKETDQLPAEDPAPEARKPRPRKPIREALTP